MAAGDLPIPVRSMRPPSPINYSTRVDKVGRRVRSCARIRIAVVSSLR